MTATLSLDRVSVSFPLYHGSSRSIKTALLHRSSGGRIAQDASQRIVVEALQDVSLTLGDGDRLALVGHNGAGKTTLLRVMAGVYEPTTGSVVTRGNIAAMFDIGIGIDPELNGYDNIRLRGLLLQLTPEEVESKLQEIADFTELGPYLDVPIRTYSSGMMMRLTFAIATCFVPDIVLMDEWILAGDAGFMAKAEKRLATFIGSSRIMVLATHNEDILRGWCNRAVWMNGGRVELAGSVDEVLTAYHAHIARSLSPDPASA